MSVAGLEMDRVVRLVHEAGELIMQWYSDPGGIEEKKDKSPLTAADRAAHEHLVAGLSRMSPSIPVLSEESPPGATEGREDWERYWLVDPLDGTKEFLKGTGEFTVNVALIEGSRPTVGIVHVPALGSTYRASDTWGAEKAERDSTFSSIQTRPFDPHSPVLVGSRDHAGPSVQGLAGALGPAVEFTSLGSSLKFCLVAEGRADLYLRDRPTMEWDTAAAQCIVERAGGGVYGVEEPSGMPLQYNKSSLLNPSFLCVGDPQGPWRALMRQTGGPSGTDDTTN